MEPEPDGKVIKDIGVMTPGLMDLTSDGAALKIGMSSKTPESRPEMLETGATG